MAHSLEGTSDGQTQPVEPLRPTPNQRVQSARRERVPVRTIAATIGMVLLTIAVLLLGWEARRVLTWMVVAALLAVVLGPVVDIAERRLHLRRSLAALTGRGPVGSLIKRYKLDQYVQRNQARLREAGNRVTTPALGVLRSVASTVVALVTVFVLVFLMVLQGPGLLASWTEALPDDRRQRVRRVAADCSKAVVGYMTGNLVISVIAGVLTYIVLWILGVPYKGVVALFVGFADLIPLVGATLGAVVAVIVAALHSLPAAVVVVVFFILYQQLENHVLQPVIMSKTVELSALTVLVSILVGVELLGFLGALLAIPVAGILHVIGRDLYDGYRGRRKPEPTIGSDEIPASSPHAPIQPGEPPTTKRHTGARQVGG
jgi:predicted PurR-regulated permease PerM